MPINFPPATIVSPFSDPETGLAPEKIREATELERQIAELTAKAEALRASTAP
jgi:hypothetical protein